MAWYYRKRIKIAPGVHLNLSKSGISTSFGPRGAKINIGPKGTTLYTHIPKTGLYSRTRLSGKTDTFDNSSTDVSSVPSYKRSEGNIFCGCLGSFPHFLLWGWLLFLLYIFVDGIARASFFWWEIILISSLVVGSLLLLWDMNGGRLTSHKGRRRFRTILWVSFSVMAVVSLYAIHFVLENEITDQHHEESIIEKYHTPSFGDLSNISTVESSEGSKNDINMESDVNEGVFRRESFIKKSDLLIGCLSSLFLISIIMFLTRKKKHCTSDSENAYDEKNLQTDLSKSFIPNIVPSSDDNPNMSGIESGNSREDFELSKINNRDELPLFVIPDADSISNLSSLRSDSITDSSFRLPVALGMDADNKPKIIDLAECPNLFIAGSRACYSSILLIIKTIIYSLLTTRHPSEVKFALMDAQGLEFMSYQQLFYHYLAVIPNAFDENENLDKSIACNLDDVNIMLRSLCAEMDSRFDLLKKAKCRTIEQYNEKYLERDLLPTDGHRFLPYLIIVINEFTEFMSLERGLKKSNLESLSQLARKGQAAGCHIVLSTTQLRIEAITKEIKEQFPRTVSFKVPSWRESTFLLGESGAENLNRPNSFMYSYNDGSPLQGLHTIDIKDNEFETVIASIADQRGYKKSYNTPYYLPEPEAEGGDEEGGGMIDMKNIDERFEEAARMVVMTQKGSTSDIQRKLGMGYAKAGRVMDQLEAAGIVGPQQGSKPREVLVKDFNELDGILAHFLK